MLTIIMLMLLGSRPFVVFYRLFFVVLVGAAIVAQFTDNLQAGRNAANFFSYFTIESNIFAASIMLASALLLMYGKTWRYLGILRGAATAYMVITGIVYWALLSGIDVQVTIPWVNSVVHHIFPVVIVLDWLVDTPAVALSFKRALAWLIYPLAYLAYTLIRGPIAGWYPYPFLDPAKGGYAKVAVTSMGVLAFFFIIIAIVAWTTRLSAQLNGRKKRH